jgi:AcrR family transcriptional regulator
MRAAPFQRARRAEQKDARRDQLLRSAGACFDALPWEELTMAAVAARARLAKGTPYRYFESKEALFLELLLAELAAWGEALAATLPTTRAARATVAALLARSLVERPRLVRLLGLLHTVLERNVGVETALRFKLALVERMAALAAAVERTAGLAAGAGTPFLLRAHAVVVGLGQMTRPPSPVLATLEQDPRLAPLHVELEPELQTVLEKLLR